METWSVLARLVARLDDAHAYVNHRGHRLDGIPPLALRRFDGQLVVVGGLQPYLSQAPIGTEVLSIDGVPATQAYADSSAMTSAATEVFRWHVVPWFLTLGPQGTFRRLEVRQAAGLPATLVVPMLERRKMNELAAIREPRPGNGSELAPGIVYVDMNTVDESTWPTILEALIKARGMVFDLRGYPSKTAFRVVSAHLTAKEVGSPLFDIPLVTATGIAGHIRTQWTVRPAQPRLRAPAVFLIDGRAVSAAESFIQVVRDHRLAVLVGEPTAGTNGNVASFIVPGGFKVSFTGMRVLFPDGQTIHGRGIAPDHLARPTLAGIRSGRDEVLEAGLRVLREMSEKRVPEPESIYQNAMPRNRSSERGFHHVVASRGPRDWLPSTTPGGRVKVRAHGLQHRTGGACSAATREVHDVLFTSSRVAVCEPGVLARRGATRGGRHRWLLAAICDDAGCAARVGRGARDDGAITVLPHLPRRV